MSVKDLHTNADAFRWGGLGKTAWCVWGLLPTAEAEGTTVAALAAAQDSHPSTVRRTLARLVVHGLARGHGSGPWHRGEADVNEVARRLGNAGAGQRQRDQHAEQRRVYQDFMIARDRRTRSRK